VSDYTLNDLTLEMCK